MVEERVLFCVQFQGRILLFCGTAQPTSHLLINLKIKVVLYFFNQGNALPVPGSKYNISTESNVPLEHGFLSKNFIQKLTVKKDTENTFLFKTRQEFTGDLFFPSAGA